MNPGSLHARNCIEHNCGDKRDVDNDSNNSDVPSVLCIATKRPPPLACGPSWLGSRYFIFSSLFYFVLRDGRSEMCCWVAGSDCLVVLSSVYGRYIEATMIVSCKSVMFDLTITRYHIWWQRATDQHFYNLPAAMTAASGNKRGSDVNVNIQ